jgi:hypothetical protein
MSNSQGLNVYPTVGTLDSLSLKMERCIVLPNVTHHARLAMHQMMLLPVLHVKDTKIFLMTALINLDVFLNVLLQLFHLSRMVLMCVVIVMNCVMAVIHPIVQSIAKNVKNFGTFYLMVTSNAQRNVRLKYHFSLVTLLVTVQQDKSQETNSVFLAKKGFTNQAMIWKNVSLVEIIIHLDFILKKALQA